MIPKIIHYCWFGGKKKSKLIKKCIKSWKKFAPDFKIIEWNESNFDINSVCYVREAYETKRWAFVSDYVRFFVLFNYGGIYLDTDVELIKYIDINLLECDFVGFESNKSVASGLMMGAHPKSDICYRMLNSYKNDVFILDNGNYNTFTVCQRMTELLQKNGLLLNGETQKINDLIIYSSSYFNPLGINKDGRITQNSYSIHHYNASWYTPKEKIIKFLGPNITQKLVSFMHFLK